MDVHHIISVDIPKLTIVGQIYQNHFRICLTWCLMAVHVCQSAAPCREQPPTVLQFNWTLRSSRKVCGNFQV